MFVLFGGGVHYSDSESSDPCFDVTLRKQAVLKPGHLWASAVVIQVIQQSFRYVIALLFLALMLMALGDRHPLNFEALCIFYGKCYRCSAGVVRSRFSNKK